MPISRRLPLSTGMTLHLLEWDAPSEHTVILLHGFLDLCWSWEDVATRLDGKYHLVAFDLRGHGDSDRVGAGGYYHFADYLADLDELVELVGRTRVSLVGHSLGGSLAAYFTGTFPSRVHKLAMLEGLGPPQNADFDPQRVAAWLSAWKKTREKPERALASVAEATERLCQRDPKLDRALAARLAEHGTRREADGTLRWKHDPVHLTPAPYGYRVEAAERFWQRITCPVLLVEGGASEFRYSPEEALRRRSFFPTAKHAIVEGAGHMMQRHKPWEIAQLIEDFLK
jgi:pimeloyl-ACP methyl ester carboxylesterase